MKIMIVKDFDELSLRAADEIIALINAKPEAVLGLATGATPLGVYRRLVSAFHRRQVSFKRTRTFNLDDYVGLPHESPDSYYSYMKENFFSQVDISPEHIYLLDGTAKNLNDECRNYERAIKDAGGIDLQILGIGLDGHIGFCEPGTSFDSRTNEVKLTKTTRQSNQENLLEIKETPMKALTMGIGTIMEAKKILLLASGRHKAPIVNKALYGPVTESVPASVLQHHPNCLVILDAAAAG